MRRWWMEQDFVPLLDEIKIKKDMSEKVIIDMILKDIEFDKGNN